MTSLTVNDVTDLVKSENRIRDVTNLCEKFSITKASTPTKFEGICDDITEVIVILVF